MSCNTCTKRKQCDLDPSICNDYYMDPEEALKVAIQEEMPNRPGVVRASASIHGSRLRVRLCVQPIMCDATSKDLYAGAISKIIQRILDESDGRSQVEYADIVFTSGEN